MNGGGAVRDLIAIGVAGVAAMLLFLSLLLDWARLIVRGPAVVDVGLDGIPTWGTTYVLGVMLLVALFVGVMTLPLPIARAARVVGVGWSLGVAAIVSAIAVRTDMVPWMDEFAPTSGDQLGVDVEWRPGFYCAIAALVLMIAAFVLARAPLHNAEQRTAPPS